jgi:tRNA (guanine-N7-)-methyltransferase
MAGKITSNVTSNIRMLVPNEMPSNNDIYGTGFADEVLSVKTAYESKFLAQGMPITYLRFGLGGKREFVWTAPEEE